jgi:uncharacterized SAM-binding protein YcdF (DUF218 family)
VTFGRMLNWALLAVLVAGVVTFVRLFVVTVSDEPLTDGPIVVLGGSDGERFEHAQEIVPRPTEERPLVLSYGRRFEQVEAGGCDDVVVWCIAPVPVSTWGEAQEVGRLAEAAGWPGVTIVTTEFHTARSRQLLRRCVDAPVAVVGATNTWGGSVPLRLAVREAAASVFSLFFYRDC